MGSFKDTLLLPKTDMPIAADLPAKEPAVYASWGGVYDRMKRDGKNPFCLHDGPPYANGDIHIGHALNKILKDFVVKFQYFSGRAVEFVPGWDCHGLPIEQRVMARIRIGLGNEKRFYEPDTFRDLCRKYAAKQIEGQKSQFKSLGVVADWDHHYETMSPQYEKMIADSLKVLKENGFLERRLKPVYWSWAFRTALAEAEVEYRERTDNSIYVAYPFMKDTFPGGVLVWTTTPWTLPGNVAVALNPEMDYVPASVVGWKWPLLVAKNLVETLANKGIITSVVDQTYKGKMFNDWRVRHPIYNKTFAPIVMADFVTDDSGTGCVQIAPAHGEDDFRVAQKYDLPVVDLVGPDGRYIEPTQVGEFKCPYAGQWIFEDDARTSVGYAGYLPGHGAVVLGPGQNPQSDRGADGSDIGREPAATRVRKC
jgi:isoleucyl-tRNA synthetase